MAANIRLLFVSLGVLLAGHGLQQTLIPVHANSLGWSNTSIGLIGSAYFLGFVLGCLTVPRLLARAGHIRVFLTLAGLTAGALLALAKFQYVEVWITLRVLTGWCIAAIYATAESWINENAEDNVRGKMISVYVLVSLVGMAAGQLLFGMADLAYLFSLATILMLLALIPIGLFCDDQPMALDAKTIRLSSLRKVPFVARAGMFVSGLVIGSIWATAPLVVEASGLAMSDTGYIMMAVILGGALLQVPVGYFADRLGTFTVTAFVTLTCLVTALAGFSLGAAGTLLLAVVMFVLGGTSLSLYTLACTEANATSPLSRVEIATSLLLINGIGSIIGPMLAGFAMSYSAHALFMVIAASMLALLAVMFGDRIAAMFLAPQAEVAEADNGELAEVISFEDYFDEGVVEVETDPLEEAELRDWSA